MTLATHDWPLNKDGNAEWSIREFAQFFDITPRAVRFYEDKELLSPKRQASEDTAATGNRVFRPVDYMRLAKILRAKRLGFSLSDIKEVMDVTDGVIAERSELTRRRDNFEKVIRSLQRRREDIRILTEDLTEICRVISDNLTTLSDNPDAQTSDISKLASKYEAAFRETFADEAHSQI